MRAFAEYLRCDTQEGLRCESPQEVSQEDSLLRVIARERSAASCHRMPLLRYAGGPSAANHRRRILRCDYRRRIIHPPSLRTRILCCASQEDSPLREGAGSSVAIRRRFLRCELSQDDSLLRCAGGSSAANLLAATNDASRRCLRGRRPLSTVAGRRSRSSGRMAGGLAGFGQVG